MPKVAVASRFGYTQTTPASIWTIQHNLNITSPVVDVWILETPTGPLINSDAHNVRYVSPNSVTIDFSGNVVSGQALIT